MSVPTTNAPAYQADGRTVRREDFYAIACDPRRSVVVEACAGAGKTWMLVSRILRALLEGAQPHEILAITFTRKAAGEMRERLNDWLQEFADPDCSDERRAAELVLRGMAPSQAQALAPALAGLYERVLAGGRPVEIRTFHAWFSQLLRAAPRELLAELGLQPGMSLLETLDEHRGAVFRRFHAAVLRDPALRADHAAVVLARGRDQAQAWFQAALDKRIELELADRADVLEPSVPAPEMPAGLSHPAEALQGAAWQEGLRELAALLATGGKKGQDAAQALVQALELQGDPPAMLLAVAQALFTEKGQGGPRKQLAKDDTLVRQMQSAVEQLRAQVQQWDAHQEHLRMVRLSRVLLAEFAAYKRSRGLADMADLERCALALLRDSSLAAWVQERLDMRIRHVLIDEFQDTSPLQWHALLSWLSGYAGAGGGASGQRPPGVFIVGDPKQSIYRFRRAEPKVFEAARDFVTVGLGGHWLACDHTRRNAPEVLNAVNAVFLQAQDEQLYQGFRAHSTELAPQPGAGLRALPAVLRPKRGADDPAASEGWRDSLTTPRHEPEELLREQEARWVARAIRQLLDQGAVRPGQVFALCRKRASLRLLAQALQALHIPFAAAEDFELIESPEVRDLVAVLDVLASPAHRLSLAQALRSPLFDATDDDLLYLAERVGEGTDWWGELTRHPHPEHPALERARGLLLRWQVAAQGLPPHDLLDRIVGESGYRERVAATVPAERRQAALNAVDAMLSQALALDGARYATTYGFVRALKRRPIAVSAPVQADAVQLLTVHGAKGLEAEVVFVMDAAPEAAQAQTATLLVDWPVEADVPRRCAFVYSESRCPPALETLMAEEKAARSREELNGLYVAMTRARRQLVFSHTQPHRPGTSWWQRVEPLAQAWEPDAPASSTLAPAGAAVQVLTLPAWQAPASPLEAQMLPGSTAARVPTATPDRGTEATRLGQAVHRVLEWAAAPHRREAPDLALLAEAAAREFDAAAPVVARCAGAIWNSPAVREFFDPSALRWAGNEVPVNEGGELLRIDRLVLRDEGGQPVWWVLDYKLALQPQDEAEYRAQMQRYRVAVQALQPGEQVRCALISGAGALIEVAP